jgi:hypothetical protein
MSLVSVQKSSLKNGNPGRPNPKSPYIIIFKAEDLEHKPVKSADGVTVAIPLVFKTGKKAIEIYATPSTIKVGDKSSGDPDKKGFIHSVEFEHPGSSREYSQFINDNINENLMAIVVYPDLPFDKLAGWPGNPMQLNHEQKDDEKEDTNVVKLESLFAGDKMLHFTASFPATDQSSGAGAYNEQESGSGA